MQLTIQITGEESPTLLTRIADAILVIAGHDASPKTEAYTETIVMDKPRPYVAGMPGPIEKYEDSAATTKIHIPEAKMTLAPEHAAPAASAVPLPPTAAPSTAGASESPTVPEASAVFSPSSEQPATAAADLTSRAPTASATSTNLALDAKGLPWDARIHAGSKTKNADGSWRQRRNLNDAAMVTRVEAELRAALAAGPATSSPLLTSATASAPSVEQTSLIPTPPPATSGANEFATFMKWYVPLVTAGKVKPEQTDAILNSSGLASITSLAVRPDLIATVRTAIEALVA